MGRIDHDFIARHTEGWETMGEVLDDYPPARVSEITGLSVDDLIAGAKILADCPRWMSLWTMGLNQSARGTWNVNAICNLHLATGRIGQPGSGPFSLTGQPNAMGGREVGYMSGGLPGQRTVHSEQDRAETEALWKIPAGSLRPRPGPPAIELFHAMERGEIKALWIIGSNPVATLPNRARVRRGLERAELVVVQDAYSSHGNHPLRAYPPARRGVGGGRGHDDQFQPDGDVHCRAPCCRRWTRGRIGGSSARWRGGWVSGRRFLIRKAGEIFDEMRSSVNARTGYDVRGISHARLAAEGALTWPLASADEAAGANRRYVAPDGDAAFSRPRAAGRGSGRGPTCPTPRCRTTIFLWSCSPAG